MRHQRLFLVDGKENYYSIDQEVANLLRIANKPVILGVNKIDAPHEEDMIYEFYNLGIGDPISISASHKRGLRSFRCSDRASSPA